MNFALEEVSSEIKGKKKLWQTGLKDDIDQNLRVSFTLGETLQVGEQLYMCHRR